MTAYESATPSATNAKTAGATMNISALRRPSVSDTKPLSKLPNGCPMNVKLATAKRNSNQYKNWNVLKMQEISERTQPRCLVRCYVKRFIWIQFGSDAKQRWYYQRWKSIKETLVQNDQVFYHSDNGLKTKAEKNLDEFEFFLFRLFKTGFCWSVTHHDNDHDSSWNFTCGAIRRNVLILQFDAIFSLRFGLSFLSVIFFRIWNNQW